MNIKSLVEFLEKNGYHVMEARENPVSPWYPGLPIDVKISRENKEPLCLYDVVRFMDASGFTVMAANELYQTDVSVAVRVRLSDINSRVPA
jgi:DUF1009 family protein